MASLGNIEEFNTGAPEGWSVYIQRIKFFMVANGIEDDVKKRATFLSICGNSTFEIARSLCAPNTLEDTSFERITTLLENHFIPAPSIIVQRFLFNKRDQLPGEKIATYLAELRKIADKCDFQAQLEEHLRDRLVCGVRDEALQRKLLSMADLKFATAFQTALASETTANQVSELRIRHPNDRANHGYDVDNNETEREIQQVRTMNNRGRPRDSTQQHCQNRENVKIKSQTQQSYGNNTSYKKCFRCNEQHKPDSCRFKNAVCRFCKKTGHIEKACFKKKKMTAENNIRNIETNTSSSTKKEENIFKVNVGNGKHPFLVNVKINNNPCSMEVDSGASYSIISVASLKQLCKGLPRIEETNVKFQDYQKNDIAVLGTCYVQVEFNGHKKRLPIVVTAGKEASLLGRNWFADLGIKIEINQVVNTDDVNKLLQEFEEIFEERLGTFQGPPVTLEVDPSVQPIALKARNVAYALRPKIEAEIDRLVRQGILVPAEYSDWATPIVPVIKSDGSIRLCADYKCTLNKALKKIPYKMPAVNEILASLGRAKVFAKLDLAQAYQQLTVDDRSAKLQTIITHKGTFEAKRLQFGISVAPQIFQKFINQRLSGIPGVFPYYDDILVCANSQEELVNRLQLVFKRFKSDGLKLNREKCVFNTNSVNFLGYQIDATGVQPTTDKVRAIHEAPTPRNKRELQAFLGLVNFYHTFLRNKADVAEPLHRLLDDKVPFKWTKKHDAAFQKVKNLLCSDSLLVHYDTQKPLTLTCDASPWGVGIVLSHILEDGSEAPVAYHSRTLTAAERRYSQLDREALSIITGVRKFHNYLYGRKFQITTDHKPLLGILGENKPIPEMTSPRLVRWSLFLSNYEYELRYRPGKEISNADALSRLPPDEAETNEETVITVGNILMMENLPETPLKANKVANLTRKDPVLGQVLKYTQEGWPARTNEHTASFASKKNELSVYRDCLLWGNRVVIPTKARAQVLQMLHNTHAGIVRMKALARSYFWWPGLDKEIEKLVAGCTTCQVNQKSPARAPIHPWEFPSRPWSRIHVDFAGPFQNRIFLIVVDAFSKWLEVKVVKTTSSEAAMQALREIFATHGLPEVLVSDNGTAFTSREFTTFLRKNGIRQALVAPYHPSSNGQAERMVQETKKNLAKFKQGDLNLRLARYLITQHTTPSTITGTTPAELLLQRKVRTCFDLLYPNFVKEMEAKQQTKWSSQTASRSFQPGDTVWARNYRRGEKWEPEVVTRATGPLSYQTRGESGENLRRHVDQLRKRSSGENYSWFDLPEQLPQPEEPEEAVAIHPPVQERQDDVPAPVTRPQRARRPPVYLENYEVN